jgi:hypothetical protein
VGYEVRRLQTVDLARVLKILSKSSGPARQAFSGAVGITDPETGRRGVAIDQTQLVFAVLEGMAEQADEINAFFAGLVGMKPQQFEKEPIDAVVVILERLVEQEDLQDFFDRLSRLGSKISGERSTSSKLAIAGPIRN